MVLATLLVAELGLGGLGVWLARVQTSERRGVAASDLIIPEPAAFGPLLGESWPNSRSFSSMDGKDVTHAWGSDRTNLFERVRVSAGPLRAEILFRSDSLESSYRERYPGKVEGVTSPSGLHADAMTVFCGNTGGSRTQSLEGCTIWGYWARYGQYVIYFESFDAALTKDEFHGIVVQFDKFVDSVLKS